MEMYEMNMAYITHGENRKKKKGENFVLKIDEKNFLGNLDVCGMMTI